VVGEERFAENKIDYFIYMNSEHIGICRILFKKMTLFSIFRLSYDSEYKNPEVKNRLYRAI